MFKQSVLVLSLIFSVTSAYALELPKVGLGGGDKGAASGDIEGNVSDFMKKSSFLAATANSALVAINSAFESEEELAKKKAELTRIDGITDAKEKGAAMNTFNQSESAKAEKNLNSQNAEATLKGLDAKKKALVGAALMNFGIASLSAPSLVDKGQKIVSSASLTNIGKIAPVKDALPMLSRFVSDGTGTIAGFIKLSKGADISVQPAKADSAPAKLDF